MSQLYPGHERRVRRFRFGFRLGVLALALQVGALFLQVHFRGALHWLWLLPFVSGTVLGIVALALIYSVSREVRHLRDLSRR
jgi:hypothetical protein